MKYTSLHFTTFLILTSCIFTHTTIDASLITWYNNYQQKTIKVGQASWYSETDPGINIHTANMEVFDDSGLTAAMWDVPFHQRIKVTNFENGKSVVVRVNDRGPHRRFVERGRIIDLSKQAFLEIAPLKEGLINIQLELL